MFNNKGQSLVMFVLILPIFFLILLLVVDLGKMILLRQELNNISYLAIDCGLDNQNIEKIKEVIFKNKDDIDTVDINIEDNKIYVILEDSVDMVIPLFDDIEVFKIKSSYVGYVDNDKKIIERDK